MEELKKIPDNIKCLISGHLTGSLNTEELYTLKKWISESPDNKRHFNKMRYAWIASCTGSHKQGSGRSMMELMNEIPLSVNKKSRSLNKQTWLKIAASWTILLLLSGVFGWFLRGGQKPQVAELKTLQSMETTVQTKLGSQSMVDLPDGSTVWLNAGSKLTYNESYDAEDREVSLIGEACFDVKTNPEKPFVVRVGDIYVKAFGTTFNIKAYPEDQVITTTLVKGKVIIEGTDVNDEKFSITMKPNENITYLTNLKSVKEQPESITAPIKPEKAVEIKIPETVIIDDNINPELFTSWKDDSWIIEKQLLENLVKDLERRYDVEIQFASDNISGYHFSGTIQRETIEQVMLILQRTIPLKYAINENTITIREDRKLVEEFDLKNK
jgi:Fe2+-dicitrate sensor, membrane component